MSGYDVGSANAMKAEGGRAPWKIWVVCWIGLLGSFFQACIPVGSQTVVGTPEPQVGKAEGDARSIGELAPALLTLGPRLRLGQDHAEGEGFVRGHWPLVVDFRLEPSGSLRVLVTTEDGDSETFCFTSSNAERKLEKVRLPEAWGKSVRVAHFDLRAFRSASCVGEPLDSLALYGLGAGPRAVGSVAIHALAFDRESIDPGRTEESPYRFRVENRFQKIRVTVFRRFYDREQRLVRSQEVLAQGDPSWKRGRCRGRWDGRDGRGQISEGAHYLQAQGWLTGLDKDRDWVVALSENTLEVVSGPGDSGGS